MSRTQFNSPISSMPSRTVAPSQSYSSLRQTSEILDGLEADRVLIVAGRQSYENSGAASAMAEAHRARRLYEFRDFTVDPKIDEVQRGLDFIRSIGPDAVVAIGGGSVMDMAKLITIAAAQSGDANSLVSSSDLRGRTVPLVVAPTTCGSGSEATHFAVVYADGKKHSVAHPTLLPDAVILDDTLTASLPPYQIAVSGLDALCHAIESYWSVLATDDSRRDAMNTIQILSEHLLPATRMSQPQNFRALMRAANLAGRAINVTKTTLSHALSYTMTSQFGIPHGHAVALTLGAVLEYNSGVTSDDCVDQRGPDYVYERIREISSQLGCETPRQARQHIKNWMDDLDLESSLASLGIKSEIDLTTIACGVNHQRLKNNPRSISTTQIRELLESIV